MHAANHISYIPPRTPPVFISGSLSIRQLPLVVKERLCVIVDHELPVVIGDAPGADTAVQRFFADCGVRHLTVFCSGAIPRNNVGAWPVRQVRTNAPSGTRAFHSAKDREMSGLAGTGFVIWDGASQGSRANIRHLCERGRCIDVFLRAENRFAVLSNDAERMAFLTSGRLG